MQRDREDTPRDPGELIRWGTIASVDLAAARCTVKAGDVVTGPIRWIESCAGATRSWSPPSVDEQVLLICAEGEIAAGVALRGLVSAAHPAPGNSDRELIQFADGTVLAYSPTSHLLEILLGAGGTLQINAPEGVSITGNVTIDGDVEVTGKLTATDDVEGGGKSLKSHKHTGVQAGGAVSGAPQ